MLIYLIGCLLGFGITYTFVIPHYKKRQMPTAKMYIYGTVGSWLTVAVFVFGLLKGVVWGGKDED